MTYITLNHFEDFIDMGSLRPNMKLRLKKLHDNARDDEAIGVFSEHGVPYGYVANSVSTVARGTHSAGYLYQLIEEEADCVVCFVLEDCAIAQVKDDESCSA